MSEMSPELRLREDDQSLPKPGKENVIDAVILDIKGYAKPGSSAFEHPELVAENVIHDLEARLELGIKRYGQPLQTFNGRDALKDLYEEVLDAVNYAKQYTLENPSDGPTWYTYIDLLIMAYILREKFTPHGIPVNALDESFTPK